MKKGAPAWAEERVGLSVSQRLSDSGRPTARLTFFEVSGEKSLAARSSVSSFAFEFVSLLLSPLPGIKIKTTIILGRHGHATTATAPTTTGYRDHQLDFVCVPSSNTAQRRPQDRVIPGVNPYKELQDLEKMSNDTGMYGGEPSKPEVAEVPDYGVISESVHAAVIAHEGLIEQPVFSGFSGPNNRNLRDAEAKLRKNERSREREAQVRDKLDTIRNKPDAAKTPVSDLVLQYHLSLL